MPKMKHSGVEWIGYIPNEWNINKLKNCAKEISSGGTPESSNNDYYNDINGIPWVAIGDMSSNIMVNDTAKKITESGIKSKRLKVYPKGTLLYSIFATIGKTSLLNINATINQAILAIIPNNLINKIYLKYQLNAMEEYVIADCSTNTQSNLNSTKVKNFNIVLPMAKEQKLIADFLDKKIKELDEVLNDLNKQVEILINYRKSLITEKMTKGLNLNVKCKNSNYEWINQIPSHWYIKPMKYITNLIIDGTHKTPTYIDDGVPFLRVTDITSVNGIDKKIDLLSAAKISLDESKILNKRCRPEKGDLLVSKNGTIGVPKIIDWDWTFSIFVSLCLIKVNSKKVINKYLYYYFRSSLIDTEIAFGGKTNTITNLHLEKISNFKIPLPPIKEQKEIVEYLDRKCELIDKIIEDKQKQIEKIEEYKKSVIYEYVTGKKRVGGAEELYE